MASTTSNPEDSHHRITPQAGRALEKLGHAIEYLSDDLAFRGISKKADPAAYEAIEILMALNLEIYYECPAAESSGHEAFGLLQRFVRMLRFN